MNSVKSTGSGWRMTYAPYPAPEATTSYDRASASEGLTEGLSSEPHAMQPFDWMHDAGNIVQYTERTEQRIAVDDPARSQGQMLMNQEQFIDCLRVGVGWLPDGIGDETSPTNNTHQAARPSNFSSRCLYSPFPALGLHGYGPEAPTSEVSMAT
ncbi:hypothetical protein OBBRIDRAFT_652103 [Obba rivulosa]|uniref:Uncharacterized protein n=1 Tax=Obba rivulosa TaxID=1052685 RepID=A0A8E2DLA2_9APHY|nr:hypothetical protein OBBRIDRAFT_652103 [Obba rivulosa]